MKVPLSLNPNIPLALLCLGAIAGIIFAGLGTLQSTQALPENAIARINHTIIDTNSFERVLTLLEKNTDSPLSEADRSLVLNKLIEEELMVQQGVDLGYISLNSTVRNTLIQAVTDSVLSEQQMAPTTGTLKTFYETNQAFFTKPALLQIEQIYFRKSTNKNQKSLTAYNRLKAGAEFKTVKSELGDSITIDLPRALLPPKKLLDYLGPSLLREATALTINEVSEPITTNNGTYILKLVNKLNQQAANFETIRKQVETEWARRNNEKNIEQYVEWLRNKADVVFRVE